MKIWVRKIMLSAEFFPISAIALQKHVNKHVNKYEQCTAAWSSSRVSDCDSGDTGSITSAGEQISKIQKT